MSQHFSLDASAGTHPGQLRKVNQDSVLAFVRPPTMGDALGLLVVADGMGGHQAGEVASKLAVDTIRDMLAWMLKEDDSASTAPALPLEEAEEDANPTNHLERRLQVAVEEANKVIYRYAQSNPIDAGNLGCTTTCAMVYGNSAVIANVGDSRAYRFTNGELIQITEDHSYVWQLVREGHIESKDIYDHPSRNVITRALGNQLEVEVDLHSCSLDVGDRLLLCSDGVWEMIRDPAEIAELLQADELEVAVKQLIDAANFHGGADNIGVVVAELGSTHS